MAAPKGNQFWKARSTHGPKPKFANPDDLWDACEQYFQWVVDNPLQEEKGFAFQGVVTKETFSKMRAMTLEGLQDFIDISPSTWAEWRKPNHGLSEIVTRAERIVRRQKFEGAAADLLNPNIIARDLGLAEKQEHTGKNGGPIEVADARERLARKLAGLAAAADQGKASS